jgi:RNA-directed DNA polymerase
LATYPGTTVQRHLRAAAGAAGLDRFIQQAVMQVLQRRWDRTFSPGSYGFRPGRSAHQAVAQAQQYIAEGYGWCVDLDLEKFFDRVNHDKLMG